jgi:DNA (cytosine-5)-methyltransferase 1
MIKDFLCQQNTAQRHYLCVWQDPVVDVVAMCILVDDNDGSNNNNDKQDDDDTSTVIMMEDVLVVPQRFTKTGYALLLRHDCVARPWNLEGRYGSRIHRIDDKHMGLPMIHSSPFMINKKAAFSPELRALLDQEGVAICRNAFFISHRGREPPVIDAQIHPERAPKQQQQQSPTAQKQSTISRPHHSKPAFTYAELFAGIGGFGVALDALGGKCIFCSELEDGNRGVYSKNFPDTVNLYGDIFKVPDDAFPKPQTLDLLVGGFPCQPFSTLGEQPGLDCPKGNLFLQIVRVLRISQPTAFLLENVPGLLQMTETYATIVSALESAGYTVHSEVCNARGLTATNRKRLFLVGLRQRRCADADSDADSASLPTLPAAFEFPHVPDLGLRACDVIDYGMKDDKLLDLLRLSEKTMTQLLTGKRFRPASMAWPNSVCYTLISHYGNSVGRGESQLVPCPAPSKFVRRFSPRECARIMGFPNSFKLSDQSERQGDMAHIKEQYRMVGNAVCPPLIAALAGAVLAHCGPSMVGNVVDGYDRHDDWVVWGRETAIRIAYSATLDNEKLSTNISLACVPSLFLEERTRREIHDKMLQALTIS